MADPEDPGAPTATTAPAAPSMTEADFVEEFLALLKRAEDGGLSPMGIVVRVCFRRGVGILDGFLANVEIGSGVGKKG